ncbi:ER protein pkr1 domain-containing protein [Hirsutella rhossiliensis]|uniref:ER protein pkr1 domain-containing protein n=1 Tax=Hirsutella rhossiliensis TaxID=111463 RepID=A0A9P8SMW2_9HYPO|nr:ER protein pkr1 domain-containing protein [Hirsutella rhossiliensis]KAH0967280.1 ER protein pkr1 domain-containing protein [Hirsutella rhossiliensis]
MASFMVDLWESIFTPGPTPTILKAANASFAALQLVLAALLAATASVHFAVLSVLCAGLWWSINWFAAELAVAQKQQQLRDKEADDEDRAKKKKRRHGDDAEASSDTEVEGSATRGVSAAAAGELRQRAAPAQASPEGTQSSVSTEDEWEKVSGSERDKAN